MTDPQIHVINAQPRRVRWWTPVLIGAVVLIAGVGLLLWPFVTASNVLAVILGVALLANGLAVLLRSGPNVGGRVLGIVLLLAGVLTMVFSAFTVKALVVLAGSALLVLGVTWIVIGVRLGASKGGFVLVPGILAIVGGVFSLIWPAAALSIVAFIAGIVMLGFGASLIWGGVRMRNVRVDQTTIIVE